MRNATGKGPDEWCAELDAWDGERTATPPSPAAVEHERLADVDAVVASKAFCKDRLGALAALLR